MDTGEQNCKYVLLYKIKYVTGCGDSRSAKSRETR